MRLIMGSSRRSRAFWWVIAVLWPINHIHGNCLCPMTCCNNILPYYQMTMTQPKQTNNVIPQASNYLLPQMDYHQGTQKMLYVVPTLKKDNKLPDFPLLGIQLPPMQIMTQAPSTTKTTTKATNPKPATTTFKPATTTPHPTLINSVNMTSSVNPLDRISDVIENSETLKEAQSLLHQILDILSQRAQGIQFDDPKQSNMTSKTTKTGNTTIQEERADIVQALIAQGEDITTAKPSTTTKKMESTKAAAPAALHSRIQSSPVKKAAQYDYVTEDSEEYSSMESSSKRERSMVINNYNYDKNSGLRFTLPMPLIILTMIL